MWEEHFCGTLDIDFIIHGYTCDINLDIEFTKFLQKKIIENPVRLFFLIRQQAKTSHIDHHDKRLLPKWWSFFSMSEALPSLFSIRSRRNFVVKISYLLGYVFTSSLSHSKYISLVSCIFLLDASSCSSLSLSYSISLSVTLLQILSVLGLSGLSIYSFHLSGKSSLESIMIISLGPEASKKIYF